MTSQVLGHATQLSVAFAKRMSVCLSHLRVMVSKFALHHMIERGI